MDENTLARPHIGHLKQHQVGGHIVNGKCSALLEAHLLGHGEGAASGHNNHFLPHAAEAQHDNTISHLMEKKQEEMMDDKVTDVILGGGGDGDVCAQLSNTTTDMLI